MINLVKTIWQMSSAVGSCLIVFAKTNASKEIRRAEKLLVKYQISRMFGKPGIKQDSKLMDMEFTEPFNAYVVGATSYNATEAAARAHEMQVLSTKKMNMFVFTCTTSMHVLILILMGRLYLVPFILPVYVIVMANKSFSFLLGSHAISAMSLISLENTVIELVMLCVEYIDILPNSMKGIAYISYVGLTLFVTIARNLLF